MVTQSAEIEAIKTFSRDEVKTDLYVHHVQLY